MDDTTELAKKQEKIIRKMERLRKQNDRMIDIISKLPRDTYSELYGVADRIRNCGTFVSLAVTQDDKVHINRANFCRERQCAICAWRRQARFVATTYPALEHLAGAGYTMLMMTLTVKNCKSVELRETITRLLQAYSKLSRTKLLKGVEGTMRAVEVTYNENTKLMHPHIHALLIMPPEYSPLSKYYIQHEQLIKAWRKALNVSYDPDVNIQLLRTKRNRKAYIETIKYVLKPARLPEYELANMYYALKGRRLISFSGVLSKLRRQTTDDALIEKIPVENAIIAETVYRFNVTGGYYEIEHCSVGEGVS